MRIPANLRPLPVALLLGLAFSTGGCKSMTHAREDGTRLDNQLHAQMTAGNLGAIYAAADDGFKETTPEDKFDGLFHAIAGKLGQPVSSNITGWRVNATTEGTFLYITANTKFSRNATGVESITWLQNGGDYKLYGYNINSDELITR